MNCRTKSAIAGPGQATHPSPSRKRRWRSRGNSAVVKLKQELDLMPQRLDWIEQLEAVAACPGREAPPAQGIGEQLGGACGELLRKPERHRLTRVDRAAERDQRPEAFVAAICSRLVAEHAALRVAGEMHVIAGRIADPVDRVRHRQHVIRQRALEAAGFALGRAEVDHPWVGAVLAQDRHRAGVRSDVIDLGGEHQRRYQQDRRPASLLVGVVVTQAIHALL
jgi:hypothetical protein